MGINRAYVAGDIEKTPAEKQRDLDAKMKDFLAKEQRSNLLSRHHTESLIVKKQIG